MRLGDVLVAGQRMADEDRVVARRAERAVGLVGDRERPELDAAVAAAASKRVSRGNGGA
jgi:hypothetical protein